MTFYKLEHEGVQTDDEAIAYAERHVEDGDEDGYGYTHCDWCGEEWPCTTAALLHIVKKSITDLANAEARGYFQAVTEAANTARRFGVN